MKVEASGNTKKPSLEGEGEPRGGQEDQITPLQLEADPETGQINW